MFSRLPSATSPVTCEGGLSSLKGGYVRERLVARRVPGGTAVQRHQPDVQNRTPGRVRYGQLKEVLAPPLYLITQWLEPDACVGIVDVHPCGLIPIRLVRHTPQHDALVARIDFELEADRSIRCPTGCSGLVVIEIALEDGGQHHRFT